MLLVSSIFISAVQSQQGKNQVEPPKIEIGVEITSGNHQKFLVVFVFLMVPAGVEITSGNHQKYENNQEFLVLVDTWWKILAWSLAVLLLSCLCCYFSRCCYLCWDCCSDPFWGCCPQSYCCNRFLLMKGRSN